MATDRWVVYATFDALGAAAPFAEAQLAAYRELGFEALVVDTSPVLTDERIAAWERSGSAWVQRPNVGYDFLSYRYGLRLLLDERRVPLDNLDLLLTNDSCYGPYLPLATIFRTFDAVPRDGTRVFGMTDSDEAVHHLQSYWLWFRADVVRHALDFLESIEPIEDREAAVGVGELGLSRHLVERGCELVPWCGTAHAVRHFARFRPRPLSLIELALRWPLKRPRYSRYGDKACLQALLGRPFVCNPTLAFGSHLHFQAMLPFVKRLLVRENPHGDVFVPASTPSDPSDNASVDRWLRSTPAIGNAMGGDRPPAVGATKAVA